MSAHKSHQIIFLPSVQHVSASPKVYSPQMSDNKVIFVNPATKLGCVM